MIDPRISLGVQAPKVSQALDIFERTKQGIASRDAAAAQTEIAQAQEARRAALDPLNKQSIQQGIDINKQALESGELAAQQAVENRILKSVNDFAVMNAPMINRAMQTQDPKELQQALIARKAQLTQQGLPTEQTDNAIMMLGQGNVQGVVEELQGAVNLYRQGVNQGMTSAQREHQGHINTIQDPNATPEQVKAAKVALRIEAPAGTSAAERIATSEDLGRQVVEQKQAETQAVEEVKANAKGKSEAVKAGVGQAVKAFEKIPLVKTAISNYDEAIAALDAGAETGSIDQFMPSFRKSSKELDNVIKRLGLDVVGNTTFGALSESELKFALKAAIPDNLQPEELKQWLTAKKNAQQKILTGLNEMANYLGGGEKTISDWNNFQAMKKLNQESEQKPEQVEAKAQGPLQVGRFTVEVQ